MAPFQEISQHLAAHSARPLAQQELRSAAVLVPLFLRNDEPWALFTRRTEHLKNHGGEISFPGGGVEPEDKDLWQTALRETEEEMGIAGTDIKRLGQLDDFISIYGYLVTPYVGSFSDSYPYNPDPGEIAEIIELPLQKLRNPQIYHQEDWQHKGRSIPVDFYQLEGHNIWGMTAAILKQLLHRLEPFFIDSGENGQIVL